MLRWLLRTPRNNSVGNACGVLNCWSHAGFARRGSSLSPSTGPITARSSPRHFDTTGASPSNLFDAPSCSATSSGLHQAVPHAGNGSVEHTVRADDLLRAPDRRVRFPGRRRCARRFLNTTRVVSAPRQAGARRAGQPLFSPHARSLAAWRSPWVWPRADQNPSWPHAPDQPVRCGPSMRP